MTDKVYRDQMPALTEIVVTGKRKTPAQKRRAAKKAARKEKRLKLAEIRTYKRIEDAQQRLETIEQKRDPYSHGGRVKPN